MFGKNVTVLFDPNNKYDRWGRIIGKVLIEGNDECLEQVRVGLAWHFKRYEKGQSLSDRQLYAKAEQEARAQKRGLWRDSDPTPPWDFRHHTTGSPEETVSDDETSSENRTLSPVSNASISPLVNDRNSGDPVASNLGPSQSETASASSPWVKVIPNLSEAGTIRGNRNKMIYHWPGCPNYDDIAPHNRVPFQTREDAERAGYRRPETAIRSKSSAFCALKPSFNNFTFGEAIQEHLFEHYCFE